MKIKLNLRHRNITAGDTITLAGVIYEIESKTRDEFPEYMYSLAEQFRKQGFVVKTRLYTRQALFVFVISK